MHRTLFLSEPTNTGSHLTDGRVVVRGRTGRRDKSSIRRADYVLYHKPGKPQYLGAIRDLARGLYQPVAN